MRGCLVRGWVDSTGVVGWIRGAGWLKSACRMGGHGGPRAGQAVRMANEERGQWEEVVEVSPGGCGAGPGVCGGDWLDGAGRPLLPAHAGVLRCAIAELPH